MFQKVWGWIKGLFSRRKGGDVEVGTKWDEKTEILAKDEWGKLKKVLSDHRVLLNEVEKAQEYHDGEFKILNRKPKRKDDPNHRLAPNYASLIIGMKSSYMLGIPIAYDVPKGILMQKKRNEGVPEEVFEQYKEEFLEVTEENDDHAVTMEAMNDGLIAGAATVLFYFNDNWDIKYQVYTFNECIPVVEGRELKQAIRTYKNEDGIECIEIYDSQAVTYLIKDGEQYKKDPSKKVNPAAHHLPVVPAAVFINGKKAKPHFSRIAQGVSELGPDVRSLLDEYSRIVSDNANRMDVFCDPYLKLIGALPNVDDVDEMRRKRVIAMKAKHGEQADIGYLEYSQESAGIEAHATRILDDLFQTTSTPKIFKSEAVGNLSSVAIRQLYTPLDNEANEKETWLNKFIRQKVIVITMMLNVRNVIRANKDPSTIFSSDTPPDIPIYDWRWMYWDVKRNLPQNDKELAETLVKYQGILSERTLLKQISYVEDIDEEIAQKRQEALDQPRVPLNNIDGYLDNLDAKIAGRSMDDDET